jgi:ferredoxin-NADP reductase
LSVPDDVRLGTYRVQVVARTREADDVVGLELAFRIGEPLPGWSPGAHIDITLQSGLIRQYSLCGDPADLSTYRIAALREAESRGGSREIHESVVVGTELEIRAPRNHFPLVMPASSYLSLRAASVLPRCSRCYVLPNLRARPWKLVYGGRRPGSMAFLDEVQARTGGEVEIVAEDTAGRLDLDRYLSAASPETKVYCCGPEGLIEAVESRCQVLLPPGALHVERFSASQKPDLEGTVNVAFEVELRRSARTIVVPTDRTLLSCVSEVEPDVRFACEEGFCGTCETTVLEGIPDHRDTLLADEEKSEGHTMMICVSRSRTPRLVLDL